MIRLSPGSTAGLLAHELRLTWRGWFGPRRDGRRRNPAPPAIALTFLIGLTVFAGTPLALWLQAHEARPSPLVAVIGSAIILAVFTLMLSQTLIGVVRTFYEQGDLDLLLTSPVPPFRVLAVKALAIALGASVIFALFLTPFVGPAAVIAGPRWLAIYAVLAAVALSATSVALLAALGLFALVGPRATKTVAQLLAAVTGAAFFIASQLQVLLGEDAAESFWLRLSRRAEAGEVVLPPGGDLPIRAALGEPAALLAVVAAALALFALAVGVVGRRFARDAAAAKGADRRQTRAGVGSGDFTAGPFRAVLRKELRLLLRDPGLISQVLLRVLYLVPLAFLVVRNSGEAAQAAVAGGAAAIVFMSGQVGASLSWITVSAEDSPGLLFSSPAPAGLLWRGKLAAAMLPLAVLVAVPLAALAYASPRAAAIALVGSAAAGLSAGLINIWVQKPTRRSEFRRRRSSSIAAGVAEVATGALFAGATGLAIYGFAWWAAVIPAALGLAILAALRRPERIIIQRLLEEAA